MDARLRRVNKEITGTYVLGLQTSVTWTDGMHALSVDCKNDKTSNVQIELIDSSPFHLKGSFRGPEGTPYEGGRFDVVSLFCILFARSPPQ